MTRTVRRGGTYLDSGLYGCLGVGIPFANAAKLKNPGKRVLLIIGDGSVGFNFMEFQTAIRNNIPVVMVIGNDTLWGMIAHSQQIRLGHAIREGTEIGKVRLREDGRGPRRVRRIRGEDRRYTAGARGGLRVRKDGLRQRDGGPVRNQPGKRGPREPGGIQGVTGGGHAALHGPLNWRPGIGGLIFFGGGASGL